MPDDKIPDDLRYWMGKVDTRLGTISELLESRNDLIDDYLNFKNRTNERLAAGNKHFESSDRRLMIVENDFKQHSQDKTIHRNVETENKYLTWPWILEHLIVPVIVWAIIVFLTFLLISQIPVSIF